ncbi:MAG: O-antigen ligase family protein, partial [Gammaproteobacteria bacterium]|nr:O-antigen ligase family protein [Gammaproteobacteria bacterium]
AELGLVLALIFTIIFFLISRSNKIDKTLKIVIYLLPLIIFIIYMANDGWLNRFFFLLDNAPQRLVIWQVSLELYYNYWLTGVGPGNFQYLYPIYQPFGAEYHVDHAHNDYLELMTEQGITGLILLSLPIISVITLIAKNVTQRKTLYTSGVQLASLIALIAILLHASVDFLFQIPAITAYFFIYMAIALRSCQFKNG